MFFRHHHTCQMFSYKGYLLHLDFNICINNFIFDIKLAEPVTMLPVYIFAVL